GLQVPREFHLSESGTRRLFGPGHGARRPHQPRAAPQDLVRRRDGRGVWKTTNGGITWQSVSSGLGSETVGDLAVAPSDSNILWVGTGEKNSLRSQYWGDGVYKSTDGGKTWTRVLFVDDTTGFVDLEMEPG